MAAQDFYNSHPAAQRPSSPYQSHGFNPEFNSPTPPPASQSHSGSSRLDDFHGPPIPPPKSDYDDSFHSYGHQTPFAHSQQSLGGDSAYYGSQGRIQDNGHYADEIPLRPQNSKMSTGSDTDRLPAPVSTKAKKAKGIQRFWKGDNRIPWVCYILTFVQCTIFIYQLIKNAQLTGSPIMIKPSVNPFLGPSPYVLINTGARYVPCMRSTPGVQNRTEAQGSINWHCPNSTSNDANDPSTQCQLSDLCGFSPPVPNPRAGGSIDDVPQPNQWFRFIIPMFLHAGIIHIAFNMLLQLTLGRDMEILIGPIRFSLIYFAAGIFGFVLGGNYAPSGIASVGASGSLFGIIALYLIDLLYTWKSRKSPWKDFAWIMVDIVVSFVLGLLPGLDNFAHIGGFLMGLGLGICLMHSPDALRARIGETTPYEPVMAGALSSPSDNLMPNSSKTERKAKIFTQGPVGFFKGRKPLWWLWWILRAGALVGVSVAFIVLLNNFYNYRVQCSWCKHLSCLPIKNWCDLGNLDIKEIPSNTTSSNPPSKRDFLEAVEIGSLMMARNLL